MKLFCTVALLFGLALPVAALDRDAFSFTRYDLDVAIDTSQQRIAVRGKVTLRNDSDSPQRSAALQISSSLHWASIQLGNTSAEFVTQPYTSDIDHTGALSEAIVAFPKPLAPKETIELTIGYEGVVQQDTTRLTRIGVPPDTAKHSDWDQIGGVFTGLRGIGYVAWYPVATNAASMSDASSVSEAVGHWKRRERDAEMRVSVSDRAASLETKLFCGDAGPVELSKPAVCWWRNLDTNVPFLVASSQERLTASSAEIFYLPEHKSSADDYAMALKQVGPTISVWLGGKVPATGKQARVVDLPDASAAPFESGNTLLMPLTADETSLLLMAAQQSVKLDFPSPRAWISQGLAAYAQARYVEQEKNRETAQAYLDGHRDALIDAERTVQGDAAAHSLLNSTDDFYVQTKAANVWWMLRDLIGETNLTSALHNYKAEDDTDATYMETLLERRSHRDLTWFFEDWIYRDCGLPDFRIASVYSREVLDGGGYMLTVTVENLGGAGGEVAVGVEMKSSRAAEKLVVPGKSKASIRIVTAGTPVKVIVNDGSVPESDFRNNEYVIESLNH